MKIQFSQGNTPETNQVYEKLLDVSVNIYTNESSQELTSLSKEQQKIIFDILNEIDLSTVELRKNLFRRIEADPKIARVIHLAITSKKTIEDDYLAFDQELTRSHIDALQEIVTKTSAPQHRDELAHDFWNKYRGLFDKKTLNSLNTDDLYQLISLLSKAKVLTLAEHQIVLQDLPENGRKYYQVLQLDPSEFWVEICKIHPNPSDDRFIALSHYISSKEMLFRDVQSLISSDDLSKLLPHLRFGNFDGVNDDVIISSLQEATRLQVINITSRTITTLPELPSCRHLTCSGCSKLEKLPQLPACTSLSCSDCPSLKELSQLPECASLNCSYCQNLKALPELPACTFLNCSYCGGLEKLAALPSCAELHCYECKALKELPALPSCIELHCNHCLGLTELPELPVCTHLNCSTCLNLRDLPKLPVCTSLTCSNCPDLQAIPELPMCSHLICYNCQVLKKLPALPGCIELHCHNCEGLTALPELPACTFLNCSDCGGLEELQGLPKCASLSCSNCRSLRALPELPACTELNCSDCGGLEELRGLPVCTSLNCSNCQSLTALPELPACDTLNCSSAGLIALPELPVCRDIECNDCSSLRELPRTLPACETFMCENCPSLSGMMSEVPLAAQVYTGNSTPLEFIQLEVNLEEFAENPRKLLLELGDHLLQNKPFPNIYYRLNGKRSEAIDIGGVRRDFISRLMESLFKEGESNGNLLINFEKFPQLNNQEEINCYRTIGRIFALCYPDNSYFKTGALFSPELYKKITFLADASLAAMDIASDENVVSTYLYYRNFAEFLKLIDNSDDNIQEIKNNVLTHAYAFVNMEGDVEAARSFFEKKENRELLKTEIIEAAKSDPQFQAIRLIAQEMQKGLGADSWNLLHQQEASKIQQRIEGVLSKEELLNKLEWEETFSSISIDQKLKDTTKGYLKNWIERAVIEDLRKFVRAVSSNNTLGPNMLKIQLFNRGPEFIPVAHTCFFTLELSADYPNQETFDNKINVLLTEGMAGSGFQIA